VARRAGVRLVMAAKVDRADRAYHREVVEPLLRQGSGVEFIGEVDDREKLRLLADARALLFPIDWPEPFGLVMIEAMACGTPVVARRRGSVPEVVEHGRTGYVCDGDDELVRALHLADRIDRRACRAAVERRFSAPVMASAYEAIYESLADQHLHRAQPARHVHGHVAAPRS
jgi:glycosyltransferase involved in cell wall biosynthesis